MFVLKEMLPSYHKWRYNSHGVREQIGKGGAGGKVEGFLAAGTSFSLPWDEGRHTRCVIPVSSLESRLPDPGADSCNTEPVPRDRPAQQVWRGNG